MKKWIYLWRSAPNFREDLTNTLVAMGAAGVMAFLSYREMGLLWRLPVAAIWAYFFMKFSRGAFRAFDLRGQLNEIAPEIRERRRKHAEATAAGDMWIASIHARRHDELVAEHTELLKELKGTES